MSICLFVCFTGSFTHASSMTDPMDQSMGDFVREGGGGGGVLGGGRALGEHVGEYV